MHVLLNFFLSILTHLFFLFVIAKGLTGDWKLHGKESAYLLLTGLLLSIVRVFILQFDMPNLSAHLITDMNFLMILFLYFPALFLYYYKMKGYPVKSAASFMAIVTSLALTGDLIVDVIFAHFFPGLRLHWTMTLTQHPFEVVLHLLLHGVTAFALFLLFFTTSKELRADLAQNKRLQTIFLCVSLGILMAFIAALFVGYSREDTLFQGNWSWPVFAAFFATYMPLVGSLFHTQYLNKKYERQRKEDEYQNLRRYMDELEQQQVALRKFRHDYQNILLSLHSFMQEGDLAGLRQYYSTTVAPTSEVIAKDDFALEGLSKIKVRELKSIFAAKLMTAQNMSIGISTTFEANEDIDHLSMDSIALVRMLGIILDNAIEELVTLAGGRLSIACMQEEGTLTIIVQNTCRADMPKLHTLKQLGFSTKGENRGMGLNILDELEASHPNVTLSTSVEAGTFTQMITVHPEKRVLSS